jgi:phage terminase small subunit
VEEFMDGAGPDAREVRKIKLKLHSKREALVDLGKHFGVFENEKKTFLFAVVLSDDEKNA